MQSWETLDVHKSNCWCWEQIHPINSQVEQWLYLAKFAMPYWHASFLSMVLLLQNVECTPLIEPAQNWLLSRERKWVKMNEWRTKLLRKFMHTVCVMKAFPVEFTESSRSLFSLFPWSAELGWGSSRKQTKENVRGATTCVHNLLQFSWHMQKSK